MTSIVPPGYAQTVRDLPIPGRMMTPSSAFAPALLKGIKVYPENPFQFDFIVDTGHVELDDDELKAETKKLIKYFLAALTVPEDDIWVNLSPHEPDRIIPDELGQTEMGRDLLAQDYLLKQLTASLMYPEDKIGKKFWERIRQKAYKEYGTTEIPMDSFHKVWITPNKTIIYANGATAFVKEAYLKVMLENDYLARTANLAEEPANSENTNSISLALDTESQDLDGDITNSLLRKIIIPEIEKEVNQGETFAQLRQIFHSLILAMWFKQNLRKSIFGQLYVDQNKTKGVHHDDPTIKQKIYEQYLTAYKKGVYNYIKEDYDPQSGQIIPRKYFSGGIDIPADFAMITAPMPSWTAQPPSGHYMRIEMEGKVGNISGDVAMLGEALNETTTSQIRSNRREFMVGTVAGLLALMGVGGGDPAFPQGDDPNNNQVSDSELIRQDFNQLMLDLEIDEGKVHLLTAQEGREQLSLFDLVLRDNTVLLESFRPYVPMEYGERKSAEDFLRFFKIEASERLQTGRYSSIVTMNENEDQLNRIAILKYISERMSDLDFQIGPHDISKDIEEYNKVLLRIKDGSIAGRSLDVVHHSLLPRLLQWDPQFMLSQIDDLGIDWVIKYWHDSLDPMVPIFLKQVMERTKEQGDLRRLKRELLLIAPHIPKHGNPKLSNFVYSNIIEQWEGTPVNGLSLRENALSALASAFNKESDFSNKSSMAYSFAEHRYLQVIPNLVVFVSENETTEDFDLIEPLYELEKLFAEGVFREGIRFLEPYLHSEDSRVQRIAARYISGDQQRLSKKEIKWLKSFLSDVHLSNEIRTYLQEALDYAEEEAEKWRLVRYRHHNESFVVLFDRERGWGVSKLKENSEVVRMAVQQVAKLNHSFPQAEEGVGTIKFVGTDQFGGEYDTIHKTIKIGYNGSRVPTEGDTYRDLLIHSVVIHEMGHGIHAALDGLYVDFYEYFEYLHERHMDSPIETELDSYSKDEDDREMFAEFFRWYHRSQEDSGPESMFSHILGKEVGSKGYLRDYLLAEANRFEEFDQEAWLNFRVVNLAMLVMMHRDVSDRTSFPAGLDHFRRYTDDNFMDLDTMLPIARELTPESLLENSVADAAMMGRRGFLKRIAILSGREDQALISSRTKGGIDFKADTMDFEVEGHGIKIDFPFHDLSCLDGERTSTCDSKLLSQYEQFKASFDGFDEIQIVKMEKISPKDLPRFFGVAKANPNTKSTVSTQTDSPKPDRSSLYEPQKTILQEQLSYLPS